MKPLPAVCHVFKKWQFTGSGAGQVEFQEESQEKAKKIKNHVNLAAGGGFRFEQTLECRCTVQENLPDYDRH